MSPRAKKADPPARGRPQVPLLWKERILDCALEIIDTEGLDVMSTRRLARELGVKSSSLYNHFENKDELLRAVAEYAIRETPLRVAHGAPRDMLLAGSKQLRDAFLAHPALVPVLVSQHRTGMGWDGTEAAARRLVNAGVVIESVWVLFECIERFVIGFVVREAMDLDGSRMNPDPARYPTLRMAAEHRLSVTAAFDTTILAICDRFLNAHGEDLLS